MTTSRTYRSNLRVGTIILDQRCLNLHLCNERHITPRILHDIVICHELLHRLQYLYREILIILVVLDNATQYLTSFFQVQFFRSFLDVCKVFSSDDEIVFDLSSDFFGGIVG